LGTTAAEPAAPTNVPAEPTTEPADNAGFDDFSSDKPFDDEPFDAGVEADEATDPKKYIEQLTGKLGQSLRKYTETQGQPDFELEKFAVNSLLSATHTSEMDEQDKSDIIKKVNSAGADNTMDSDEDQDDMGSSEEESPDMGMGDIDFSDNGGLQEAEGFEFKAKKSSLFAPEGSDEFMEENRLEEVKPCWSGYKQVGMKTKNGKEVPNCVPVNEESKGLWANIHAKKERGESPVSKIVEGELTNSNKNSIFTKDYLKMRIQETFINETEEPRVLPQIKPQIKPSTQPSRRNRPFLPERETQPDPKALNEGVWSQMMKGVRDGSLSGPWSLVAIQNGKVISQDNDIRIKELIPARYEAIKTKFPNSSIHIEDDGGQVVWSNSKLRTR
jgi:hypothetical protein